MRKPKKISNKTFLSILENGINTKIDGYDEELTHYCVLDSTPTDLLVCFSGISWKDGETYHKPHRLRWADMNKTWFVKEED